jgi:hypothetical protein
MRHALVRQQHVVDDIGQAFEVAQLIQEWAKALSRRAHHAPEHDTAPVGSLRFANPTALPHLRHSPMCNCTSWMRL